MSFLGGLFGGSSPQPISIPEYTGVQLQTSSNATPIPIVYGTNTIAPNIIFAGLFIALPLYNGKNFTGYNYFQNLIFGLCEGGPSGIARIGYVFQDSDIFTMGDAGCVLETGSVPPALPNGPAFVIAARQTPYAGTAYASAKLFNLGSSASTGSLNFEVHGIFDASSGINGFDADPAQILQDFLTNTTYGCGLPASCIDQTTFFSPSSGPDSSYQGYCRAANLAISPALVNAEKGNSIVTRWLQLTNAAPIWSGGKLKVIPYGDTANTKAPVVAQVTQPLPAIDGQTTDGPNNPYIIVNSGFIADMGVVNADTGQAFIKVTTAPSTDPTTGEQSVNSGEYYMNPSQPGFYIFAVADQNLLVTITYSYAPLAAFTPNLTPVYDLDDDDYVSDGDSSDDPVLVARTDPFSVPNVQRVEIVDRFNFYSATSIEVRDQNAVETYGYRLGSTITAHEITTATSAQIIGQLILQRGLGIRNTYTFKLSWEFCLLEPMDIITLTDPNLGLAKQPVRIADIEEDDDGLLSVTAEEFLPNAAIGTAALYGTGGAIGGAQGTTTVPNLVNPPMILEAPAPLANNQVEIIFAVSASAGGAPDPNYGGCNIFVSYDGGTTYVQAAAINGQSAQGTLTAALPAATSANPDTTDTLAVTVAESGATLPASTQAQAQSFVSLALVDGELISYGAAAGTPGGAYSLTYLERGVYGTANVAHASGAPFTALEGITASAVLPSATVHTTVYFKFQGFNIFQSGLQPLSSCTAYPLTVTGIGLSS